MNQPNRHSSHVLENASRIYFESILPSDWISDRPQNDYGADFLIQICENGELTNGKFLVQLKSSDNASSGDEESVRLKVRTYNYLDSDLYVVLIVKFIRSENICYYKLLHEVPVPNQLNETFTIHIPKSNILDDEAWNIIRNHVSTVTNGKLNGWRNRDS